MAESVYTRRAGMDTLQLMERGQRGVSGPNVQCRVTMEFTHASEPAPTHHLNTTAPPV